MGPWVCIVGANGCTFAGVLVLMLSCCHAFVRLCEELQNAVVLCVFIAVYLCAYLRILDILWWTRSSCS
jgi:hypothetical protein